MDTGAPYDPKVTSLRPRTLLRVRPGLLAPAVVVIVLGILGMHGVDPHAVNMHGTAAHDEAATPSSSVMLGHEPVAAARDDAHSTTHSATSSAGQSSGDAGGMSIMMMVCVAILAGAATLLVLLVRRGRLPKVWAVLQPARRVWRPDTRVLRVGTGPPSVWRFSVIRC